MPPRASRAPTFAAALLFAASCAAVVYAAAHIGVAVGIVVLLLANKLGGFQFANMVVRWLMLSDSTVYSEMLRRSDTMPSPVTTKTSEESESSLLAFGYSCMQGWRRSMEDAHTTILTPNGGFFAVYDGHSGQATAQFCGINMFKFVTDTVAFKAGKYSKALYEAFMTIDLHLHKIQPRDRSGCTAVAVLIEGNQLYCANAGDSRGVLCRGGEAVPLSYDHKPTAPVELARIEKAGGFVVNRRVNGVLALSRAIGDFSFKANSRVPWEEQAVTAAPDVKTLVLDTELDEFAVIACDGIWDVMSNEQVVAMVRTLRSKGVALSTICEQIMTACLSPHPFGLGCDNMSVIIVTFKKHQHSSGRSALKSSRTTAVPPVLSSSLPLLQPIVESSCGESGEEKDDGDAKKIHPSPPQDGDEDPDKQPVVQPSDSPGTAASGGPPFTSGRSRKVVQALYMLEKEELDMLEEEPSSNPHKED
jgi:serine/threonine protein phosphatase PrpC